MKTALAYIALLVCTLCGCGGGSEGTGTEVTRKLAGQVATKDGAPLSNAHVTLLETGNSTTTDRLGFFTLGAPLTTSDLTLEVAKGGLRNSVVLRDINIEATTIDVSLTVDEDRNEITASSIQVWSRVVGDCDRYFENKAIIRQAVVVSRPLVCTMRFFVSGDGRRLERVAGEIQVRACNSNKWRTIAEGATGFGVNAGFGDIEFTFIDDRRNCEYRVAAPLGLNQKNTLYIYLETLTYQSEKKAPLR